MGLFEIDDDQPVDEDDFIDEYYDDDWEDDAFPTSVKAKYPGWALVKLRGFNDHKLAEIKEWCELNVHYGQYRKVGWTSGCAYSVGMVFESKKDAMMFKLRW